MDLDCRGLCRKQGFHLGAKCLQIGPGPLAGMCYCRGISDVICHYWMRLLCREPGALGKGLKAFGKDFAESHVAGSRQRLCRRPEAPSAKPTAPSRNVNVDVVFAESRADRLSAKTFYFFLKKKSLPKACQTGSRQRRALPRAVQADFRQGLFIFIF